MALHYFCFHKPFQVLSQFSREGDKSTLADYLQLPTDVYPLGRLDYDSEGLLLLTNDKRINHRLLHPQFAHEREYWVQVDGAPSDAALTPLRLGVPIRVNGSEQTSGPCAVHIMDPAPTVAERNPPVRFRQHIPTTWLALVMQEGKNRQVRKMTAAIGFPTLRLIRYRIEKLTLDGLQPGDVRELQPREFLSQLRLS